MTYTDDQKEILKIVKGYVDRVDSHDIDTDAVLPDIVDIINDIEELAMRIERGEFER